MSIAPQIHDAKLNRRERTEGGDSALFRDEADGVAESRLIRVICAGGVRAFETSRWA